MTTIPYLSIRSALKWFSMAVLFLWATLPYPKYR